MGSVLEYKDYWTEIKYSAEDGCMYGKIEGIDDLISFSFEKASEAEHTFHETVDEYLADCKRIGKEPNKTYKGTFNIRMSPELHRAISRYALSHGSTLNQFMVTAARHELSRASEPLPPQT